MDKLPIEYRNIKLLNGYGPISWIMYLFDVGFDMTKPELYYPDLPREVTLKKYQTVIDEALERDREKRQRNKKIDK